MKLDSIVGTRVNRFIVQEKIRMPKATGGSGIIYKCLCDCGKTFYLPSNDLQRHTPRDCGCGIRGARRFDEVKKPVEIVPVIKKTDDLEANEVISKPTSWKDVVIPSSKIDFYLECLKQKLGNSKQVYRGVRYKKFIKRYRAYIGFKDKEIGLGCFKDINDAAMARLKAEIFYRGGVQVRVQKKKQNTTREKVVADHIGIVERAGERHFAFIVVKYAGAKEKKDMWLCKCDCGKYFFASSGDIQSESVKDCGCQISEKMRKPYKKHLFSNHQQYENNGTNISLISDKRKKNNNNSSGFKGIYHDSKTGKWVAKLVCRGVVHRETTSSINQAIAKRKEMEKEYFNPLIKKCQPKKTTSVSPTKRSSSDCHELRFKLADSGFD